MKRSRGVKRVVEANGPARDHSESNIGTSRHGVACVLYNSRRGLSAPYKTARYAELVLRDSLYQVWVFSNLDASTNSRLSCRKMHATVLPCSQDVRRLYPPLRQNQPMFATVVLSTVHVHYGTSPGHLVGYYCLAVVAKATQVPGTEQMMSHAMPHSYPIGHGQTACENTPEQRLFLLCLQLRC